MTFFIVTAVKTSVLAKKENIRVREREREREHKLALTLFGLNWN
jgi:hypothetical protein